MTWHTMFQLILSIKAQASWVIGSAFESRNGSGSRFYSNYPLAIVEQRNASIPCPILLCLRFFFSQPALENMSPSFPAALFFLLLLHSLLSDPWPVDDIRWGLLPNSLVCGTALFSFFSAPGKVRMWRQTVQSGSRMCITSVQEISSPPLSEQFDKREDRVNPLRRRRMSTFSGAAATFSGKSPLTSFSKKELWKDEKMILYIFILLQITSGIQL